MAEHIGQLLDAAALALHHVFFAGSLEQAPEGDDGKDGVEHHQRAVGAENLDQLGGEGGGDGEHQRADGRTLGQYVVADVVVQGHRGQDCHLRHRVGRDDHAVDHVPRASPDALAHRAGLEEAGVGEQEPHVHHQHDRREDEPCTVLAPGGIGGFAQHAHQGVVDRVPDVANQKDDRQLGSRDSNRLLRVQGKVAGDGRRDCHRAAVDGCCVEPGKGFADFAVILGRHDCCGCFCHFALSFLLKFQVCQPVNYGYFTIRHRDFTCSIF